MAWNLHHMITGGAMNRSVFLISKDPTFVFMMTTIIDHLNLPLQSSDTSDAMWDQIAKKSPAIVIWDFDGAKSIQKIEGEFHQRLPESCHLFLFSNALAGMSHLKNGRLHLFEKPFSPSEISRLIRDLTS
jgi:hypothetical protein